MLPISGRVDEGDRALLGTAAEIRQPFCLLGEFGAVAAAELVPTFGIMAEPSAQFRTWRDFLDPLVEPGLRLADAARPQAIDENSCAVRPFGRIVRALEPDVRSGDRAADDSGDLRKQARRAFRRDFALEFDFGAKTFEVAMDHCHRELAAIAQIGDGTVAGLDRAVDHDLVPFLRMTDIGNSEVVLLGPEEGDRIERFTAAEHVARGCLALALGNDEMLDADRLAAARIRPAGDVPGGEHATARWSRGTGRPALRGRW